MKQTLLGEGEVVMYSENWLPGSPGSDLKVFLGGPTQVEVKFGCNNRKSYSL